MEEGWRGRRLDSTDGAIGPAAPTPWLSSFNLCFFRVLFSNRFVDSAGRRKKEAKLLGGGWDGSHMHGATRPGPRAL